MTDTHGTLALNGKAMRGVQSGRLQLFLNGEPQHIDEGEVASVPEAAVKVAGIYAILRDDILNGTINVPDFNHAVQLTRFVDAVLRSSHRSTHETNSGWPKA